MQAYSWRPIESAPKDGTRILLWSAETAIAMTGWWSQPLHGWEVCHAYHGDSWSHFMHLEPPSDTLSDE